MIEVSHLTKKYGSRLAVDDISFTVEDGVIYGLLGPNGAGKSTIMNILTGYLAATEGQVTVAGHPLPEEADAAKACVGYLPEQPPLYPEMTVAEYLDFAAELKGVKKADRPAQVQSAAHRTGLEDVLPRLIRSLSKGYRQRVGVAQACWAVRSSSFWTNPPWASTRRRSSSCAASSGSWAAPTRSSCPAISSVR